MKIQMGVTQKMKLYNVYRLCKENIHLIDKVEVTYNQNTHINTIKNWLKIKETLNKIEKIPALMISAKQCINSIPDVVRHEREPRMTEATYTNFNNNKNVLLNKMQIIIELYESMKIGDGGNGIDIKLPPCDNLKDYISYLKDIDFIFSQCPFLQCENEILKFESVDVGSNWIKLTLATATTCMILNNTAALIDKALILRSHYISIQQQEELLKSTQSKNELGKAEIETFNLLRKTYMNTIISILENDLGKLDDPEERDKAERSLESLIELLDKGAEIYATLDAPEDVQALFPEIQGNLELPDKIMKYLENKEETVK